MDPEEAVGQVVWDLDHDEHTDAMLGLEDYAQWVSRGGFSAGPDAMASLDAAATRWADRWDTPAWGEEVEF